jgi:diguanylate cyclase (GGDEF)-like protein
MMAAWSPRRLARARPWRGFRSPPPPSATDPLTGLTSRMRFFDLAAAQLCGHPVGKSHALLLLDLNRFKEINDSLGHWAGDEVLAALAGRLARETRQADLLARLGDDEFVLLLAGADAAGACAMAGYLRSLLQQPLTVDGVTLHVNVSIGVATYPQHGSNVASLLRHADVALRQAKQDRDGPRLYQPAADQGRTRLVTIDELGRAITEGQLLLHYQPKMELPSRRVVGVEALVRWAHPERGLLYPEAFLSLAEEGGLMGRLTDEVLRQALNQCAAWWGGGWPVSVAVNLAPSSVLNPALPGMLAERLSAVGLPASALQVEVTEDVLLGDQARARRILEAVRRLGVEVALDDFGSGYSSLAYLRELPVDVLKLDQAFVRPMSTDPRAAALVQSAVDLAHSLGLRMVAEGVDDARALERLADFGCDTVQGFHVCRPIPSAALQTWLNGHEPVRLAG